MGGGFGHLTRACALARAASAGTRVRILTNSPYAGCIQQALPALDLVVIDPAATIVQARNLVDRHIDSTHPDCLIVDTFPRGLGGELVETLSSFAGRKVLVQRDLNPRYRAAYDLNRFVEQSYDLVLMPGDATDDGLGPFPQSAATAPWLVRSHHEMIPRHRAREVLGLRGSGPCVLVCAAGNRDELNWYGEVAAHLLELDREVRCLAPVCPDACPPPTWIPYWPAMDLYSAADVVVGGAGYNTIYECLACGIPLAAKPWPRQYDRQALRAERVAGRGAVMTVDHPKQAAIAALHLLSSSQRSARPAKFQNGASDAVAMIETPNPRFRTARVNKRQ